MALFKCSELMCLQKFIIPGLENGLRWKLFIKGRHSRCVSHKMCCPISHSVDLAGEYEGKELCNADLEEDDEGKD